MKVKLRFAIALAVCPGSTPVVTVAFSLFAIPRCPHTRCVQPRPTATTSRDGLALFVSFQGITRDDDRGEEKDSKERTLEFQLHSSIGSISADDWNDCLTDSASPFLQHSWLQCLEDSRCASASTGWVPQHVSIQLDGETVGYVPLYIKSHSMGEFIFDQQFAEAAYQSGMDYYPKLLVGIPFTPATGHRILWHPTKIRSTYSRSDLAKLNRAVANFLKQVAISNKLSSVHLNYLTDEEATDLGGPLDVDPRQKEANRRGNLGTFKDKVKSLFQMFDVKDDYLRRTSLQYVWTNVNPKNQGRPFESFDAYLKCFKSKKRINIRRERRIVLDDENVQIDVIAGKGILKHNGLMGRMFDIYVSTVDKLIWGRQYLTLEFFEMLAKSDFIENLVFVCCRRDAVNKEFSAKDVFAGTFNVVKNGVFYGRYWGCLPDKEIKNLHFECCYWSAIDYCIAHGLQRMEPGAGGGDYKWARGFDPVLVQSVHYFCHPVLRRAVGRFLSEETENNFELSRYLWQKSAVSNKQASSV